MRRALSITLLAVTAVIAAGPAAAQQPPAGMNTDGQSLGLRYLSWPGRTTPARTEPERPVATPLRRSAPTAPLPTPTRQPARAIIPHGVPAEPMLAGPGPATALGLTPANAWMTPTTPAPVPATPPPPASVTSPARPVDLAPAPPVTTSPSDPMAPRRDALIFQMQATPGTHSATPPRPQPQVPAAAPVRPLAASSTAGPAEQGARYYSVHRQNNRQPDPTPLPPTTYVDAIAIDLPTSLASQDLAAPAEPPTLVRNAQGRLQAMPDTSTPDQL